MRYFISFFASFGIWNFLSLALHTYPLQASEFCGSKIGYFNQLASLYLIPKEFPPENQLNRLLSKRAQDVCRRLNVVNLETACVAHDSCYAAQRDKKSCDQELADNWASGCQEAYGRLLRDDVLCQIGCEAFVYTLSEAQQFEKDDFCPSCDAYEAAKK